jgi:hypothetical protein
MYSIGTAWVMYCTRVSISPTTSATNNTVTFSLGTAITGTVTQAAITVKQVSPFYAQSGLNPLPVYVNSAGTVVDPVITPGGPV